ncbi:alpha-2,8-sialyltransferase 8F-like isoform 3-T3 [Pholidichthys leucotaenia]
MRGAMRGQLFSMIIMLLCMGSLVTTIFWFLVDKNYADYNPPRPQKKEKPGVLCKGCKKVIDDVNQHFSEPWQKQEENYKKLRSLLNSNCSGFDTAIITQTNTPLGTKIKYDGEDTYLTVTPTIFKTFLKEHPFLNKTWNTCAVVGNGGILAESYCGKMIDSAELVMRCNLPPVTGEYERHVGSKTDFVTANPTIVKKKWMLKDSAPCDNLPSARERETLDCFRSHDYNIYPLPGGALCCSLAIYTPTLLHSTLHH